MNSADVLKSLVNGAPFDGSQAGGSCVGSTTTPTADDFGVIKFTGGVAATETTHSANAVPTHWQGREVGLVCSGGVCHFAFSFSATAEVDRGVSATAAGAAGKVGLPLPNSVSVETRARIPKHEGNLPVYFVRESDATGVIVYMRVLA